MGIVVPDSHKSYLREAYEKILADFKVRWRDLNQEWMELEPMLQELKIEYSQPVLGFDFPFEIEESVNSIAEHIKPQKEFDPNWSWLEKSKFILEKIGRPMTAIEIVDVLIDGYQPGLTRKLVMNSVPATLSVAARENKIGRETNKYNEYVYWLK